MVINIERWTLSRGRFCNTELRCVSASQDRGSVPPVQNLGQQKWPILTDAERFSVDGSESNVLNGHKKRIK